MVRQPDPLDPHRHRLLRVGDGLDALEHDRPVPHRAQPVDVGPRQRLVELAVDVSGERDRVLAVLLVAVPDDVGEHDRVVAQEVPCPAGMDGAVEDRLQPDLRREREPAADVALTATEHRGVDGEPQRRVAGGLRPTDEIGDQSPVTPCVHLEPLVAVGHRGDLLDRPGAHRRQRVRQAGAGRGAGDREFTLGVGDARVAGRRDDQRHRHRAPEQGRRRIERTHVAQHPGPELDAPEAGGVLCQRTLVLGGTVDVVEHTAWEATLGDPTALLDRHHLAQPVIDGVQAEPPEANLRSEVLEHSHATERTDRAPDDAPTCHEVSDTS